MTGDSWIWLAGALVGGAILLVTAAMVPRMARTVTTSFYCPWRQRSVTVRYLTCDGTHPIDVLSCTALAGAPGSTCAHCVDGGDGPAGLGPSPPRWADRGGR